jgi:hypothetical protein
MMNYDAIVDHAKAHRIPPPTGEEIVYGGVHINKFEIPAGMILISHCHVYDHPSILASGEVELWTPEGLQRFTGPTEVKIAAGVKHALTAITDTVWYCIHAGEPQIVGGE